MKVVKILPRLPTRFCGVGDHATAIGEELAKSHGCSVSYLGVNPNLDDSDDHEHWVLPERTGQALLDALRNADLPDQTMLVLHYSAYSYGNRGICWWLPKAIGQFQAERPDVRLTTMFHELWAPGSVLSRSGWVIPIQRAVIRKLARQSDFVRTNRFDYAQKLQRICPSLHGKVRVKNICSNFGEPPVLPSIDKRKRQIVIFQPPDVASPDGKRFWDGWECLARQLNWPSTIVAGRARNVPCHGSIELRGFVSAQEGSDLMLESQFVYFDYYNGYLGKSSFFGSIAAHGIAPIMPGQNDSEADNLHYGRHYLVTGDSAVLDVASLQSVTDYVAEWYRGNSISETASDYAQDLTSHAADFALRRAA